MAECAVTDSKISIYSRMQGCGQSGQKQTKLQKKQLNKEEKKFAMKIKKKTEHHPV